MRKPSRRQVTAVLVVGLCALGISAVAAGETDPRTGRLQGATWRFTAWGRNAEGLACWLRDPDGSWRMDILMTPETPENQAALNDLMQQLGDGWTVVATGDRDVFLQPWHDKIEELSPAQQRRLTALLVLSASGKSALSELVACGTKVSLRTPRRRGSRTPWPERSQAGGVVYDVTWPAAEAGGFRARLETRGRGRGAMEEVWSVHFAQERKWRLTSSRRAGNLQVADLPDRQVAYYPDEVFIPLWSLAELLTPVP